MTKDTDSIRTSPLWREDLAAMNRSSSLGGAILAFLENAGFRTLCLFRWSASLYPKGRLGKKAARLIAAFNHFLSGCDIDPRAKIGGGCRIVHPVGIVIGDNVRIGKRCWILQNVTLGSAMVKGVVGPMDNPVVGDDVVIGAGAVVVGAITVGNEAKIGANAVVLKDVPAGHLAVGVPARVIPSGKA